MSEIDGMERHTFRRRVNVSVLGAGGIGGNFLRYAGLGATCCPKTPWGDWDRANPNPTRITYYVYEFDTVELSNLNRSSMFTPGDIGKSKNEAIASSLRRLTSIGQAPSIETSFYSTAVNRDTQLHDGIVVDCRDTIDPAMLPVNTWVKCSYDGGSSVSWHFVPDYTTRSVWRLGGDSAYEVTPSFYVAAAMIAVMTRNFMRYKALTTLREENSRVVSMQMDHFMLSHMHQLEEE